MELLNKHKLIFILLYFFNLISADNFDFKNYSVADGLSESTINVIHEDQNGFIYLGTENGLIMFDGIKFFIYHALPLEYLFSTTLFLLSPNFKYPTLSIFIT